jgi:hypothetical protein
MKPDIFEFWGQIASDQRVHPADIEVMRRVKHSFNLESLPICFFGPLRSAEIVLLFLSPGDNEESYWDQDQRDCGFQRTGRAPLPGPEQHRPRWKWWTSRTKQFGEWVELRNRIAVLNIGAYHSRSFTDEPLLAALPSSRLSLDWAQTVLFPQAERGERLVVCLRSAPFWGLEVGRKYGQALFAPEVTRGGHMLHGEMREEIVGIATELLAHRVD